MIREDRRAVSVAVTHTLMLGITGILIAGLLLSSGSLLQTQENRVAQQQVDEVSADILSHVDTLDRLNETGESVETTVRLDYPDSIAGKPYTVSFDHESGDPILQIDSTGLERTVSYPISDDVSVQETSAPGDSPRLSLCTDGAIKFGTCP